MSRHEFIDPDDGITEPDIPVYEDEPEESPADPPWWRKIDWALVLLFVAIALVTGFAILGAILFVDGDGYSPPGYIPIT